MFLDPNILRIQPVIEPQGRLAGKKAPALRTQPVIEPEG